MNDIYAGLTPQQTEAMRCTRNMISWARCYFSEVGHTPPVKGGDEKAMESYYLKCGPIASGYMNIYKGFCRLFKLNGVTENTRAMMYFGKCAERIRTAGGNADVVRLDETGNWSTIDPLHMHAAISACYQNFRSIIYPKEF